VAPASINSPTGLITNKRSIESNVLVEDGAVVVLGGLLQDEYVENEQKVPGVSDVPLFGNLFKNQSRDRKKTNLMIFLRPMVVRTGEATKDYSLERYNQLRSEQQKNAPKSSALVRINEAPVLPALEQKKD
jgi:general secretion pathway protein D